MRTLSKDVVNVLIQIDKLNSEDLNMLIGALQEKMKYIKQQKTHSTKRKLHVGSLVTVDTSAYSPRAATQLRGEWKVVNISRSKASIESGFRRYKVSISTLIPK